MTNHRKKTRRIIQNGGAWYNPGSWFSGSSDPNAPSYWSKLSGLGTSAVAETNQALGNAVTGAVTGVTDAVTGDTQVSTQDPILPTVGGRRRKRRSMKGGKGGLGLTYYASPVSGLKVAQPTTWQYYGNGTNQYSVKGGSRKRNKRKSRKYKKY